MHKPKARIAERALPRPRPTAAAALLAALTLSLPFALVALVQALV